MRTLKEGIYQDVDFQTYLGWDAINNSSLHPLVRKSPKHYFHALSSPQDDTQALRIGRLIHLGKLEPAALLQRYWVLDEDALRQECRTKKGSVPESIGSAKLTTDWKERVAALEAAHPGKERISQTELDQLVGVCNSLAEHPVAGPIIRRAIKEVSWVRKVRRGRRVVATLKGRIDLVEPGVLLADFKTCADISDDGISRAIWHWGYYRQAAFYQDAWAELSGKGEMLPFFAIFGEKEPPYAVRCAPIHGDDLEQGRQEYESAIQTILQCRQNNRWPGPDDPEHFRVPRYRRPQMALELDGETVEI